MNFGFRFGLNKRGTFVVPPNQPLIDYTDWTAITSAVDDKRYIADKGEPSSYPLALNSGGGVYFNGVDQSVKDAQVTIGNIGSLSLGLTIDLPQSDYVLCNEDSDRFYIKNNTGNCDLGLGLSSNIPTGLRFIDGYNHIYFTWDSGVCSGILNGDAFNISYEGEIEGSSITIANTIVFTPTPYNGTLKDLYIFNRALTQTEITKNYEQPEQFFIDAKNDATCVLVMPMNESSTGTKTTKVINYKDMTEYPIANYTTASRISALNIQHGLQNSKLVRDTNGVISGISDYLEFSGNSTATIPFIASRTVDIALMVYPTSNTGNVLSGGVVLSASGLTLNQDNIVTLNNKTITSAITMGSGFIGTIKEYKETLI